MLVFSVISDSATPWTVAHQAPVSMGFPRQEYWIGLSFPTLGYLPDPGIETVSLVSPALAGRFFTAEPPGKPLGTRVPHFIWPLVGWGLTLPSLCGLQGPAWKTTFFTSGWASRAGWDLLIDRQTDLWWWRLWFVACPLSQTHRSLRDEQMPPWQTVSEIKTLDLRLRFIVNQKAHPCPAQLPLQGCHGSERANLVCILAVPFSD